VPAGEPAGPVDALSVDGTVVPVRERLADFAADVRARRVALLRTDFVAFSASGPDYPLFRLTEAGVGNLTERSTLCCLRCSARHSITTMQVGMLTGRAPTGRCLRCGCPDAVLVHDPAATVPDQPHELRPVTGAGKRVDQVWLFSPGELDPAAVRAVLDLARAGEDFEGARVRTMAIGDGNGDPDGLADAILLREGGAAAVGARRLWVRVPRHGDVLVAVVTSG
jgi:hypothetical protein